MWWGVAADLAPQPVPKGNLRTAEVYEAVGATDLLIEPRERIVATWVVDDEVLGWAEVAR